MTTPTTAHRSTKDRQVLLVIATTPDGLRFDDITAITGIDRTTTYLTVATLCRRGLLAQRIDERRPGTAQRYWHVTDGGQRVAETLHNQYDREAPPS